MAYENVVNHMEQGGAAWVVGGTLTVSGALVVSGTQSVAGVQTVSGQIIFTAAGRLDVGTFASALDGSGVALTASKTAATRIYGDTGSAAIAAGSSVRATVSRMLIGTAPTAGDTSIFGAQGQVKAAATVALTGHVAGVWGYFETVTGVTVGASVAGVYAMCDIPNGATIASGGVAAGLLISSNSLAGTHTGKAAMIHANNPVAGTWDYAMIFGDTTGVTDASAHGTTSGGRVKIRVGATDKYIHIWDD